MTHGEALPHLRSLTPLLCDPDLPPGLPWGSPDLMGWALSGPPREDVGRSLAHCPTQGHFSLGQDAQCSQGARAMELFMEQAEHPHGLCRGAATWRDREGGARRAGWNIQEGGLGWKSKGGARKVRPRSITAQAGLPSAGLGALEPASASTLTANLNAVHSDFSPQELLPHSPSSPALCLLSSFVLHAELLAGLGTLAYGPSQCLWFPPFLSPFLGALTKH